MWRRTIVTMLTLATTLAGLVSSARADAGRILAPVEAHAKASAGEIVLVDVRTPEEWRETGVPQSARMITMHQEASKLLAALDQAVGGDRSKPIALICRTGNRTTRLQGELRKVGFTNLYNVAEGVVGGPYGPGWLKANLPVRKP